MFRAIRSAFSSRTKPTARRSPIGRALRLEQLESRAMMAVDVVPMVESASTSGADDVAIWIHPEDPSLSTVIGTAKTSSRSIRVYDLSGAVIQSVSVPNVNNIDLRYNFLLAGEPTTIVAGSNRDNNSIVLYRVDPQTRMLTDIAARTISTGIDIYGCALYVSPITGKYFVFITSESGQVQQWELFENGAGRIDASRVRTISVGSISEGIVADDELGHLYVGEENVGIWKYDAEPAGGSSRTSVDTTGRGGQLDADVEGLSIYYAAGGRGYLLASSQGADEFNIYRRDGNNAFVGSFQVVAGNGIDAVSNTDGIDVTNYPLGDRFPQGMFVAQDNDDNYKFVRWDAIAGAVGSLVVDTSWDPREVGAPAPQLHGDYNLDSRVDAADFTVWRDTLGQEVAPFSGADGDGNGLVDAQDYLVWKDNFGASNAASGATPPAVSTTQPATLFRLPISELEPPLAKGAPPLADVPLTHFTDDSRELLHHTLHSARNSDDPIEAPPREQVRESIPSLSDFQLPTLAPEREGAPSSAPLNE